MREAAIFDLDGLLIDSEPIWRAVEQRVFGDVGIVLDDDLCHTTMGMTVDAVVAHWYGRAPWSGPDPGEVEESIVAGVVATIRAGGAAMPGVDHALAVVASLGLRVAIASSSHEVVIAAALDRLGIADAFEAVVSAQHEPFGKPHPGVYLTAAHRLGVEPNRCVALEDSPNGVRAAKDAGMRCVAVPEAGIGRAEVAGADVVLHSLEALTEYHLAG